MAPTLIRIALLNCDTPIEPVRLAHGDYYAIFSTLLTRSLPPGVGEDRYALHNYDVVNKMEYPKDVEEYDALLMTGSAKSAYEDSEWVHKLLRYIKHVAEEKPKVKVFGICFGHQIVGQALGGSCVPNNGIWEIGPTNVQLNEVGKKIFGKGKEILNIQQFHRDHVITLPTQPYEFQCIGSTELCANQGMVLFDPSDSSPDTGDHKSLLRKIRIFTTQGHPELHASIITKLVDNRERSGMLSSAVAAGARVRNNLEVSMLPLVAIGNEEEAKGRTSMVGIGKDAWKNDGLEVGGLIWGILGL